MARHSLVCPVCGYTIAYGDNAPPRCPRCGSPLTVDYNASKSTIRRVLWESRLRQDKGVWSFSPLLPVEREGASLGEAWTPLLKASRLSSTLGVKELYVKNEALNPTGSFIDRGSAVEIEAALEGGAVGIVVAGLGDLASSVTAYAASRGISVVTFMPPYVEASKVYSVVLRRATVMIEKDTERMFERAQRLAAEKKYWLTLPTSVNLLEGYRTILYEIYSVNRVPDVIVAPVGDGILALALYKAAVELGEVVGDAPRIVGVRVKGQGFGLSELVIEKPLALEHAKIVVERSGGKIVEVEPSEVYRAMRRLAETLGVIADPAGAASTAALEQLLDEGVIDADEKVVVLLTGGGSRDPLMLLEAIKTEPELSRKMKPVWDAVPYLSHVKRRILQLLAEHGTLHTYAIWKRLLAEGVKISLATVHQHVKSLEADGLITQVRREGRRILYALTAKGYEALRLAR